MVQKEMKRAQFSTRLGVIATTAGSAIGLGNIWRFPYEAGNNGGGAFMLFYVLFIILLGIPLISTEFALGRESRSNIFGTFSKLHKGRHWPMMGYIGILASLMILSFYSVVAGWTIEYFLQSASGALTEPQDYGARFSEFSSGNRCLLFTLIFLTLNFLIVRRGVQKGVEKISNILMPLLFVLLIIFCINSLTMSGAKEGLTFLFRPDFSKITWSVVGNALGQAFFSLSLGLGCMMTYASYFNDKTNIIRSASTTATLDTLVAILSGVIIFPAVFTFGLSPAAGPTLVFEVLPTIFSHLPFGAVWSALFFLMLFLASITSTISMSEISISFFSEQWGLSRRGACWLNFGIAIVFGSLCALSFGPLPQLNLFNILDYTSSNLLLPIGGMMTAIFAGWIIDRNILRRQLTNNGSIRVRSFRAIIFCVKYIAPIALAIILIMNSGLLTLFK